MYIGKQERFQMNRLYLTLGLPLLSWDETPFLNIAIHSEVASSSMINGRRIAATIQHHMGGNFVIN